MDPTIRVDERVEVIAIYHLAGSATPCMPVKMKYKKREIVFTKLALCHPTTKGRRMVHVFDMSDGTNDYRLEFDAEGLIWVLKAILEGESATVNQ
jgi:hypothetical protein